MNQEINNELKLALKCNAKFNRLLTLIHPKRLNSLAVVLAETKKLIQGKTKLFGSSYSYFSSMFGPCSIHPLGGFFLPNGQFTSCKNFLRVALFVFAAALTFANHADAQLKKLEWESGYNGEIAVDTKLSTYPDKLAYFEINWNYNCNNIWAGRVTETGPSSDVRQSKIWFGFNTVDHITDSEHGGKFKGNEYREYAESVANNEFLFGNWYLSENYKTQGHTCNSTDCRSMLFRPNVDNINKMIPPGKKAISEYYIGHYCNHIGDRRNFKTLAVTIRNSVTPELTIQWPENVELNSDGNPVVTYTHDVMEYGYLVPNLSILKNDDDYISFGAGDNLNGENDRVASNSLATSADELPAGFDMSTTQIIGNEGSDNLRGGVWFFDEVNGLIAFQPMKDRLEAETDPGDVIETYLNLSINHGTGDSKETLASVIVKVIFKRPIPVLSISGGNAVDEADDAVATFTVTSSDIGKSPEIDVNYTPSDTGDFLDPSPDSGKGHTRNITTNKLMSFTDQSGNGSGPFTYTLEIPIHDNNDRDLGPQSVQVTLNEDTDGEDYVVSETEFSASVTIVNDDKSSIQVGFDEESRETEVVEGETVMLTVVLNNPVNNDITIPFTIATGTPESATLDTDYTAMPTNSVTITARRTKASIKISTIQDSDIESDEEIVISLTETLNYSLSSLVAGKATVWLVDDDKPASPVTIDGKQCNDVVAPAGVTTPQTTVAYWETIPGNRPEPRVYFAADENFDIRMGFKSPVNATQLVLFFNSFYRDGTPNLNFQGFVTPPAGATGMNYTIHSENHKGLTRYRILPREDVNWYGIDTPCEFHVVWTDASRPGITLTANREQVPEGQGFTVTATATPAPNRDITVPISFSDESRLDNPDDFEITIKKGMTAGSKTFQISFASGNQQNDALTVTVPYRSSYHLDEPEIYSTAPEKTANSVSLTIVDTEKYSVRFKEDSRDIKVGESGNAELKIELLAVSSLPVTVKYQVIGDEVTENTATKGTDFSVPPTPLEVRFPSRALEQTISIPIASDSHYEESETFTVRLLESSDALPDFYNTAIVTIVSDDIPEPAAPFAHACDEITKPEEVGIPNTEAYWKSTPASLSEPKVYIATDESLDVKIGFRDPGTQTVSTPDVDTDFLIGTYILDGTAHSESVRVRGTSRRNDATHTIGQPGKTGYFRYRLLPRDPRPPSSWYNVGDPCEFHVWWVDAGRPGISISIEESTVRELETFTVEATATPAPDRDIRIPISFSNPSLLQNGENRFIEIEEGEETGTLTMSAAALPSGQLSGNITATAPWHSEGYYMDASRNSASVSIQGTPTTVGFAADSLEKTVSESDGNVELTVRLTKPAANDVAISLSLDEGATATVGSDFNVTSYIVRIAKGQVTQNISIPILEDQVASEPKEHFDLTLAQVSGGVLLGTNKTARVYIVESTDPVVPKAELSISIAPIASEISAGVDAEFSVYMNNAPENDFAVPLTVSQEGDVIGLNAPRDVLVKATRTSAVVSIATNRNGSGSVTVSLNHRRSNPNEDSATVTVVPGNSNNEPLISVVSSVIESILLNIPHTQENTEASLKPAFPVLEINPARTEVTEGETVEFVVSTDGMGTVAERLEVPVELTEQGDFIADGRTRISVLQPGQNSASVYVATVDDDHAEYDGLITASIEAGTGYEVSSKSSATVTVTDSGDREIRKQLVHGTIRAILPSMTASLSNRSLSAASLRMTQAFSQSSSSTVEFGGQSSIQELFQLGGRTANEGKIDWREALGDSAATINLFPEQDGSSRATIWAFGNRNSYSDKAGSQSQSWNGEELAGHFGFDTKVNRTLFGFATTLSEANATHAGGVTDDELGFNSNTVGVQPYVGYQSASGDFQMHSSAGYGVGEIAIDQESYDTLVFDSAVQFATFGAQQRLYFSDNLFGGTGGFDLSSDSWIARQYLTSDESYIGDFSTAVRYLRVEGEANRSRQFPDGRSLSQQASVGLVGRSNDQLGAVDLEFEGTGKYRDPVGLEVSVTGRTTADDWNQIRQWKLMGDLGLDFAGDRQGVLFDVSPAWTWQQNHTDIQFWRNSRGPSSFGYTGTPAGLQINSRIGYGVSAFDDTSLITPFTSLDFSPDGKRVFQFGGEISVGSGFKLETWSSLDLRQDEYAGAEFQMKSRLNW